jgi:Papain-like cysteine protease AvrRpt2
MDIHLDVPFVTQMKVGAHAGGNYFNDTTGCWYAGVCMLGYYRAPGPRLGVPEQFTITKHMRNQNDDVIADTATAAEPMGERYEQLKTNEHLVTVDLPSSKKWDCATLCKILQEKGPCFVRRGFLNSQGQLVGGHIIVLVGCKDSTKTVIYHCPTNGPDLEMGIDDFNKVFKWNDARAKEYSMMYLPG